MAMILELGLGLDKLLRMKPSHESEVQGESGGKQPHSIAGAAGRYAVVPSSERSDGDNGSREGERVPEEAGKARNAMETMTFEKGAATIKRAPAAKEAAAAKILWWKPSRGHSRRVKRQGGLTAAAKVLRCKYSRGHTRRVKRQRAL